jgi:hypothetical protein
MAAVRFDDRLRTVLDQPARDPHDRAVRWRQLVDLLARGGPDTRSSDFQAAVALLRIDAPEVDEPLRAATARSVAALPLPFELVLLFTQQGLKVAAPILAAASLDADQWKELYDQSDEEVRKFILALHPEVGDPKPSQPDPVPVSAPLPADGPSISDVIARIERLREARQRGETAPSKSLVPDAPAPSESSALFRWECNPSGEFAWVEGAPRGALIGRALVDPTHLRNSGNDEISRAFVIRAPFRNAVMTLESETPLGGDWQVSGVPAFEPASGRFAGYRGIARRGPSATSRSEAEAPHPDALRELVHEIKTPLNAIMGFAEIIERQMFGPADPPYRERAAEIVVQAHTLLSAIDDLDFAAKSRSAAPAQRSSVHLGELVERIAPALREAAQARGVEVQGSRTTRDSTAAIEPRIAERLILRMCGDVIDQSVAGERLRLLVDQMDEHCRVSISRPAAYRAMSDQALFGSSRDSAGQNFRLRLTRGLAQIAGGDLVTSPETLALIFPRASLGENGGRVYGSRTGQGL